MSFKRLLLIALLACVSLSATGSRAAQSDHQSEQELRPLPRISEQAPGTANGATTWSEFRGRVDERSREQRAEGIAYMVSGGLVLIGSAIGIERSEDILAKSVYAASQSLSLAAIGYGGFLYSIGDEDRNFFYVIENSTSLTEAQKTEILKSYNSRRENIHQSSRVIRIVTHSLIAAVNFYNASREVDPGFKAALTFFGGVNAVAAVSIAF